MLSRPFIYLRDRFVPSPARLGLAGVAAWGLMSWPSPAAASSHVTLVYARSGDAAACGDETALRLAVTRRLGYDAFVTVSDSTVVVELRAEGDSLKARVFMIARGNTVGGARELTSKGKDCGELMQAVALAISIAIDPEAIERVVEAKYDPELPRGPEVAPPNNPEAPPSPSAPARPPVRAARATPPPPGLPPSAIRWQLGVGAFLATGPGPWPVLGLHLATEIGVGHWAIGIEPRWVPSAMTAPQPETNSQASTSLLGATLAPCYRVSRWEGCYLLEAARLDSQGLVVNSHRDLSLWGAQGLRLAVRLGSQRGFGFTAKLDSLLAFNRITLALNGRTAFETPQALGRLALEANYAF